MFFACPWARAYSVWSEAEFYSLCQRELSEFYAVKLSFLQTMFLLSSWKLHSSREAPVSNLQIEDGLKSISGPTVNISSLSDKWKNLQKQNVAFSHGSECAAIYCFYPFLFVISTVFIIRFLALGIVVEKWYQMCLLSFKNSLIAKEIRVYPLLLSKWWCQKLGLRQKSTFELRLLDFFYGNR